MTIDGINDRVKNDEYNGEKLIGIVRLSLAAAYAVSSTGIAIARGLEGSGFAPVRSHVIAGIFLLYSLLIFFYVRKQESLHYLFKYICVFLDMSILSAVIWVSCTCLTVSPPLPFLSSRALIYCILILAGAFRYSAPCAYFSGIYAAVGFFIVVIANRNVLDIYAELFAFFGMIITGWITGMICRHRLALFNSMIASEHITPVSSSISVEQTRGMAKTIKISTDKIFLSSKDIFSTANNQAASMQEIESTINENAQIAGEIAEETAKVAHITSKMENDVKQGFSVLEKNVIQIEDIRQKNGSLISGIITLGNKIAMIREIIRTINAITDQTKVIAFNAALEAAGAGSRGKRFSVVASEVNRLADDIAALTKQMREQTDEIQAFSSSLIVSSEESADIIAEGSSLIKELEDIFRDIHSGAEITANQAKTITVSTQKQQKSTEQVNIAIADISGGLNSFLHSTEVATASAEGLVRMVEELDSLLAVAARDGNSGDFAAGRDNK